MWIEQLYLVHDLDCVECTDMWQYDMTEMSLHVIWLNIEFHNGHNKVQIHKPYFLVFIPTMLNLHR